MGLIGLHTSGNYGSPWRKTQRCCSLGTGMEWALNGCQLLSLLLFLFFKKDFIYLLLEREEGRERERKGGRKRGRETSIDCLSHAPNQGPAPQPQHVPQPGIKPVNFLVCGTMPNPWSHTCQGYYCCCYKVPPSLGLASFSPGWNPSYFSSFPLSISYHSVSVPLLKLLPDCIKTACYPTQLLQELK